MALFAVICNNNVIILYRFQDIANFTAYVTASCHRDAVFTRGDRRGDRSRDRSPRRSPRLSHRVNKHATATARATVHATAVSPRITRIKHV